MSADNYHYIFQLNGKWHVRMGFMSAGYAPHMPPDEGFDKVFDDEKSALEYTMNNYSEYGTYFDRQSTDPTCIKHEEKEEK